MKGQPYLPPVASAAPAQPIVARIAVPAGLALLVSAVMVAILLYASARRADGVAFDRQEQLVSHVLDQRAIKLASEQESMTLKDTAVTLLAPMSFDATTLSQLDRNWGPWFHRYYGHDETYLLSGANVPFYAMRDGQRVAPSRFETLRAAAAPVIAELRAKTRKIPPGSQLAHSPGAFDFVEVNGHPAIVSVKPIISQNGVHVQTPGQEMVHISVVRLDGRLITELSEKYLFKGARFSRVDNHAAEEEMRPFVSHRTGLPIGYFIWKPYSPGSIVLKEMSVPLLLTLLLIATMVWLLIQRIRRSTNELKASEAQAKHLAFHDVLTGLPNRALFDDRLDRALAAARRNPDHNVALLCLDLDRFKQVNDTLGHPAGDELIRELARRLTGVVREHDTVARLGGDEFAIIQMDVKTPQDTVLLCERILAVVREPFDVVSSQAFVGMSIGVARSGEDGLDRVELVRKADIALYRAKAAGRGRHVVFAASMDETVQARQAIEQDLRTALERGDQLEVYYQPQYDAGSGQVSGVEALIRWHHPQQGMLCPAMFIPIAEESGLIEPLGDWVLEEACTAAVPWPIHSLSVNISAVQLRNPFFAQRVISILEKSGMDPHRLQLEITETSFIENVEQCQANLKLLRFVGIRVALDDFGTGYSSFMNLSNYQVDRLKIDPSFTRAIEASSEGSAIIRAIIALARSTGLKVTAEGVETAEQGHFLSSAGCDELQGFLMSAAIPLPELDALLGIDPAVRHEAQKQGLAA